VLLDRPLKAILLHTILDFLTVSSFFKSLFILRASLQKTGSFAVLWRQGYSNVASNWWLYIPELSSIKPPVAWKLNPGSRQVH